MDAGRRQRARQQREVRRKPQPAQQVGAFEVGGDEGVRVLCLHRGHAVEQRGPPNHGHALVGGPIAPVAVESGQIMVAGQADGLAEDALIRVELEGAIGGCEKRQNYLKYRLREERTVAKRSRGLREIVGMVAIGALDRQRQVDRGVLQKLRGQGLAGPLQAAHGGGSRPRSTETGADQRQHDATIGQLLVGEGRGGHRQKPHLGLVGCAGAWRLRLCMAQQPQHGKESADGRQREATDRVQPIDRNGCTPLHVHCAPHCQN